MIDLHTHLWPHEQVATNAGIADAVRGHVRAARAAGVEELAVTEHAFRFRQVAAALGEFWVADPDPARRASMAAYVAHHATVDLDAYVEAVGAARRAGVAIECGIEVDYHPGRMQQIAALFADYPIDVLLGSVHWLGAWRFDDVDDPAQVAEWAARDRASVWRDYTDAVVDLSSSHTVDVLAHVDLAKVTGAVPAPEVVGECHDRIVAAVVASGVAVEVSSAGWRKPVREAYPAPALLDKLAAGGARFTTASDAHGPAVIGEAVADLEAMLEAAGATSVVAFGARRARAVPIGRATPRPAAR